MEKATGKGGQGVQPGVWGGYDGGEKVFSDHCIVQKPPFKTRGWGWVGGRARDRD